MKKIAVILLAVFAALALVACSGDEEKSEETTKKSDWRNTIEYEGAFFVNESTRLFYAFDKGSITLWDSAGNGDVLQVIDYDTTVSDAIERIEKEDFNGDENCDIRIIYSEGEEGTRYTLWLWSTVTGKFAECRLYNKIADPLFDPETGNIIGVEDKGVFGTVTKRYAFNETSGLDEISCEMSDPASVAEAVNAATAQGVLQEAEGTALISDVDCKVYIAYLGSEPVAYIAHTPDSTWYIDEECRGFYRIVNDEDGVIVVGDYVDEAATVGDIAKKLSESDFDILYVSTGYLGSSEVLYYCVSFEDQKTVYLAKGENGFWYLSEDGAIYKQVSVSTGEYVSEEELEFATPESEEPVI